MIKKKNPEVITIYGSHTYELRREELYESWLSQISSQFKTQLFRSLKFFRPSFRNCKSCVFSYDDPLSYKNYPVNKPELKKKWEIVGLSSSCNLHSVTISRVRISVLKGRWKLGRLRDFSVPASPLYFLSFPCFFFFLNGPERTVMCTLYIYTASQYLMEVLPWGVYFL